MIAVALAGCTTRFPEELNGLRIVEAQIEGVSGGGMQVVGGGWSGSGELVAETVSGDELAIPVALTAGSAGMLVEMSISPGSTWELGLPDPQVPADQLFGTYDGSRESLIVVVGAVGTHLENEHGVRIDDTSFALGVGVSASWQWLHVTEKQLPAPSSADTGGGTSLPTTDTTDTAQTPPGHTGGGSTPETASTGDTGA